MRAAEVQTLPPLDAAQAEHAVRVRRAIEVALAAGGGWLSFEEYLRLVLYAPGLGYYSAGAQKFGAAGDFTTAPELTPLFGRCLARAVAPLLAASGGDLLEFGAGSGRLAATLLTALDAAGALPPRYRILEVSGELRARQRATLAALAPALAGRVEWLDTLPSTPLDGVFIANEVADALPFCCFAVRAAGPVVRGVALGEGDRLVWAERPADVALRSALTQVEADLDGPLPVGYVSELCPAAGGWVAALGAALGRGVALIVDYGVGRRDYYHPARAQGTLRCHYRHRAHVDPFLFPGLQDITAWVDFTRLAEAAVAAGLEVAGYCTQAAFLLACGIESEVSATTGQERARRAGEARQLLLPGEMGETFKVLALTRAWDSPLQGFGLQDLRRLL
ncbi:MAG: SAM-dependent methyltransferase [Gammaproteobacteria bacterium]|nr:SAM-dependent methyltransferase [Gammaproteobacteria bacterium]